MQHDEMANLGFSNPPQVLGKSNTQQMQNSNLVAKQPILIGEKIGRNDPCPCASGKKYKKCCGK